MICIHGQTTTYFDIDDTLIKWCATPEEKEKYGVEFICYSRSLPSGTYVEFLVPHKKHIEQLIEHKSRGSTIVLWSAAGSEWCETVAKTLGLEQYVDLCISKPTWAYDDLQPSEFIPKPKWMKDE